MTMDEMLTEVVDSRDVAQRDRFLDQGLPLMPQCVARNSNAQRVARSPSADRVRLSRARHKRHERVVPIEVRDSEIAALVTHGFLAPDRTDDLRALLDGVGVSSLASYEGRRRIDIALSEPS